MAEIPTSNDASFSLTQIADIDIAVQHYGNLTGSDVYFSRLFKRDKWKTTTDADKLKLLYEATQRIDSLNFKGTKTQETQLLQFPRGGDTGVPRSIEHATYELAWSILSGVELEREIRELGVDTRKYGPVETKFNSRTPLPNVPAGIVSSTAWRLLLPFIRQVEEIKFVRV